MGLEFFHPFPTPVLFWSRGDGINEILEVECLLFVRFQFAKIALSCFTIFSHARAIPRSK